MSTLLVLQSPSKHKAQTFEEWNEDHPADFEQQHKRNGILEELKIELINWKKNA